MNTQPRTASASFVFPAIVVAGLALAVVLGAGIAFYDRSNDSDSDRPFLTSSGPGTIPTQDELNAAAIAEHEAHMEAAFGPYTPPVASATQSEAAILEHDNAISGVGGIPPAQTSESLDQLMQQALYSYDSWAAAYATGD